MSPETIDAMIAAGVTAEVLAAAWKAEIAKLEGAIQERRARDADRQRRHRESRDVTVTGCDPAPNERDILTPTRETKTKAIALSKSPAFILPDDIPAEPWVGFEEMRKRVRKPMTDRARSLAVTELRRLRDEEGWPPGDVLNHCTMNSYQGIFPPKGSPNGNVTSLQRNRPNLTALLRASSGDPESGFGTRPALPASGNG